MSRPQFYVLGAITGALILGCSTRINAQPYNINPTGSYTFLPSPEGPGLAGCTPSDFECTFGMDGSFGLSVDAAAGTARLVDVDLKLIGNETVQQTAIDPLVTPAGVASWLEDREFEDLQVLGPFTVYADSTYPDLVVTDLLNGVVTLAGGFDDTPADGIGVQFDVNATVVPEPHSVILLAIGLALGFMVCDQRSQKARQTHCPSERSC